MATQAQITDERWESLLDSIELGKVVPIVGRKLSLVESNDARPVALQRAAVQQLVREMGIEAWPDGSGLAELQRYMAESDELDADTFHPKLRRVMAGMTPHLDPLRKLAEIRGDDVAPPDTGFFARVRSAFK